MVHTCSIFDGKGRMLQKAVQGVEMSLNQERDMFQLDFRVAIKQWLLCASCFTYFPKGSSIADILALSHYMLSEHEGQVLFLYHRDFSDQKE